MLILWNLESVLLLQITFALSLVARSHSQNFTGGIPGVESACANSNEQSTTIQTTDIQYEYQFLLTASLSNVQFDARLADPESALFKSTASAFEAEVKLELWPLIQNPPPSMVVVSLDADIILFRTSDLGQPGGLTLECVLSIDSDQKDAEFLQSQLQTVARDSAEYPNFVPRVSASVNYCLREVILTQEGTLTWPVTAVGTDTGTEELCPAGTRYVGERSLARRSCSQSPEPPSHAVWDPYVCIDCGKIIQVDDALGEIYNEIRQNSSVILDGVTQAAVLLNEVTDITDIGFNWVALILEYVAGLNSLSTELLDAVIRLLSNLLRQDGQTFLLAQRQSSSSSRILQSLASILRGTTLAGAATEYTSVHPNIAASLLDVPQSRIQEEWISFGSVVSPIADAPLNEGSVGVSTGPTLSLLPNSEAYVHVKVEGPVSTGTTTVRTAFVIYHNAKLFQSIQPPAAMTSMVAGRVVSADIRATQSPELSIITRFKPFDPRVTNEECRSWDPSLNNGHGDWSTPVCMRNNTDTSDRINCQCNQFAAFTIFAEPDSGGPEVVDGVSAFVRVAAVICMLCLLAAVVLYLLVKELRSRREMQILAYFFCVLAAFYLILTAGIDQSGLGCIVVGALLHYCLLVALSWMGIAWVHLYDLSRRKPWPVTWFLAKVSGPVWGIPFLFVIITVIVDPNHHVTPTQRCFLSADPIYNIIVALILPTVLMLVAMGVAFGCTARNVILDNEESLGAQDPEGVVNVDRPTRWSRFWRLWQKYIMYSALIALTVLTSVFAAVMANSSGGGAQYIFGVLAIAKGLLVIGAFCLYHREVRETMLVKLGYTNGPESKKFQPYWSTSKWQKKNQQSVLPEMENAAGDEDREKNLYLDNTQGSSTQTNQGFNPTTIPLSAIEMKRMGENGVASHVNNGIVVEADFHGPLTMSED
ncbi:adhesion G-protein coupled receptor G2-like [Acanthaster planci]|uniref:Adhesion G-protein coupled receptor G2-like n=1 Tax=Acanthaster planci TaxID=133434 RepID=A0A8B7YI84_ACAPL|nr:adhesion G-protein coupled receptor G2-like [Acanthaster planci]